MNFEVSCLYLKLIFCSFKTHIFNALCEVRSKGQFPEITSSEKVNQALSTSDQTQVKESQHFQQEERNHGSDRTRPLKSKFKEKFTPNDFFIINVFLNGIRDLFRSDILIDYFPFIDFLHYPQCHADSRSSLVL